ncbi:MAG UNVERIFIED_CONTAM: hypothetical protein LVR18_08225 [Planctomycetaceae bacterium]
MSADRQRQFWVGQRQICERGAMGIWDAPDVGVLSDYGRQSALLVELIELAFQAVNAAGLQTHQVCVQACLL